MEQLGGEEREADAEDDGETGTDADAEFAFAFGQRLDGERDDDGVVAGQEQVDKDDGQDVEEELKR